MNLVNNSAVNRTVVYRVILKYVYKEIYNNTLLLLRLHCIVFGH